MASIFTYPESWELREIERDLLPSLTADRTIFKHMPTRDVNAARVYWQQRDNFRGLQQLRGMGNHPPVVKMVGDRTFDMKPGVYGEHIPLDEQELTNRRQFAANSGAPVAISDMVAEAQTQLLQRRLDRIESINWNLVTTGTFSVVNSVIGLTYNGTYTIQQYTPIVPWSTPATSTPLGDLRVIQLMGRGSSVSFGSDATMVMTQRTLQWMLANTNNADLYGKRTAGLGTLNSLGDIQRLFAGENLPTIEINERGYEDDNGVFQLFVPDGKIVVFGKRPAGQPLGEYLYTRNMNNPGGSPGPYTRVITEAEKIPFSVQIHDGHNGGPAMYYPSAVIVMNVG